MKTLIAFFILWMIAVLTAHVAVILLEGNVPLWEKGSKSLRILRHVELILLAPVETWRRVVFHLHGIRREIQSREDQQP